MDAAAAFRDRMNFDQGLEVGQVVEARWTNSHIAYRARACVVKVNAKSLRVELLEEVPTPFGTPYPIGREIVLPRLWNNVHSVNNCAAPAPAKEA